MRKNLKSLLLLFIILTMTFTLFGCGSNDNDLSTNSTGSSTEVSKEEDVTQNENIESETEGTTSTEGTESKDEITETTEPDKETSQESTTSTTPTKKEETKEETTKPSKPVVSDETSKNIPIESISISKTSITLKKGDTHKLTVLINPSNATNKSVIWYSDNTDIAKVDNGTVTAVSVGKTNIVVKSNNGKTAKCSVTVEKVEISQDPTTPPTTPQVPTNPTEPPKPEIQTGVVTNTMLTKIKTKFLSLVNAERQKCGVLTLSENTYLSSVAVIRSNEIIEYWSHTRPDGTSFFSVIDESKYAYRTVGENLAMTSHLGNGSFSSSEKFTGSDEQLDAVANWMFYAFKNSPSHYSNMISNQFLETGIGISYEMYGNTQIPMFYISHIFATKR